MDQTELPKKTNAWQEHLKTIKEKYPDSTLSERLKLAKAIEWRKQKEVEFGYIGE